MKALVAGGAGFIGSHLCDLLLEKKYEVTVVDNFITGTQENLSHLKDRIRLIKSDIVTYQSDESFDEIYNLASPASPVDFKKLPIFILQTAALGHMNLLELASKTKARILFASTSEVYGDPHEHPQREVYFGNVNTIGPRGCYDEGKRYAEALSVAYFREKQTQIRIARIFNTYGPRMRPEDGRIIPNFFTQALAKKPLTIYGDGLQTRSFCYVSDLVAGLHALMNSHEPMPVNIGNPYEISVLNLADAVNELIGNEQAHTFFPLPENDPLQRRPDISRALELLKWKPKVSFSDGLRHTLRYFQNTAT